MNEPGLDACLKTQREIRLGELGASEGASMLRETLSLSLAVGEEGDVAAKRGWPDQRGRPNCGTKDNGATPKSGAAGKDYMKLGELLVAAGLISEKEVDIALDIANANNKMIGEVLTEHCWIEEDVLGQALTMQTEARNHQISFSEVVERLRSQVTTGTYPIQEAKQKSDRRTSSKT